ncbi:hypothetical protein B7463_g5873, partial [Scytalidium lignicola]
MQFKSSIVALTLSILAANASPAPQLDAITGLLGGVTGGSGTDPITGLLGDVTGVLGSVASALAALPSGLVNPPPPAGSTGGTTAAGGGSTSTGGDNGTADANCPTDSEQYCCTQSSNTGLLALDCIVQSVMGAGSTCSTQTVCCSNKSGTQLCTSSNGAAINVPLTLGGLNLNL